MARDCSGITAASIRESADVVVDALFGFSFRPPLRSPFDELMRAIAEASSGAMAVPVASVDVPSGWDVDGEDATGLGFVPDSLVSLTAPKPCAAKLESAAQWLGGRFVPPSLAERLGIEGYASLYQGSEQVVLLDRPAMPW